MYDICFAYISKKLECIWLHSLTKKLHKHLYYCRYPEEILGYVMDIPLDISRIQFICGVMGHASGAASPRVLYHCAPYPIKVQTTSGR